MLPDTRRVGNGYEPAVPLILAAWDTPALFKILRLQEHIDWAYKHGALEAVDAFLRSLPKTEWYHLGRLMAVAPLQRYISQLARDINTMAASDARSRSEFWGCLPYYLVICWILWYPANAAWYSKFGYSLRYEVDESQVTKADEPHDCDWGRSPLGAKGCHYEIRVRTVRVAYDAHHNLMTSDDEGKTWLDLGGVEQPNPGTPGRATKVFVLWEKISEP
jgi:hypothetical protein